MDEVIEIRLKEIVRLYFNGFTLSEAIQKVTKVEIIAAKGNCIEVINK